MASTDPKQAPRKKLGGSGPEPLVSDETVQKYLKLLQDYQNVVFAVLVLVLIVGGLSVYLRQKGTEGEDKAWQAYAKASSPSTTLEQLEKDVAEHEGAAAHPFLALAFAARLYEKGDKADLQKAEKVLNAIDGEVAGNALLKDLVRKQLAGIQKELADEKFWATPAKAPPADVTSQTK